MARHIDLIEIIHAGPAQPFVREGKTAGLYDIHADAHAGPESQNGSGVLRDIRLIEGEAHYRESLSISSIAGMQ